MTLSPVDRYATARKVTVHIAFQKTMAHKPRPRKGPSVDEILRVSGVSSFLSSHHLRMFASCSASLVNAPATESGKRCNCRQLAIEKMLERVSWQAPMQGRRAKLEAGARNVHGEIADEIVKAELAALAKQRKANDSWHVVGLDSKLDAAVMAADEHTAIRQLKRDADAHLTGAHEEAEDDEEIRRLQEEIAMLDRMNAVMYEQPELPPHERPRSPARTHPHMHPARAPDTEQLHRGGPAGNSSTDAGPRRIDAYGGGAAANLPGGAMQLSGGGRSSWPNVPAPPVPGGFLGSPGVSHGDYFQEEKEKQRAELDAKQRSYKAQLDEQV